MVTISSSFFWHSIRAFLFFFGVVLDVLVRVSVSNIDRNLNGEIENNC